MHHYICATYANSVIRSCEIPESVNCLSLLSGGVYVPWTYYALTQHPNVETPPTSNLVKWGTPTLIANME